MSILPTTRVSVDGLWFTHALDEEFTPNRVNADCDMAVRAKWSEDVACIVDDQIVTLKTDFASKFVLYKLPKWLGVFFARRS